MMLQLDVMAPRRDEVGWEDVAKWGMLGAAVYILFKMSTTTSATMNVSFCPHCHAPLAGKYDKCPNCHIRLDWHAR